VRRTAKQDAGWLAVQKDRWGAGYQPKAATSQKEVAGLVPGIMKGWGLSSETLIHDLGEDWAELVGEQNAAHCRPGRLEDKTLVIYVTHQVWLSALRQVLSRTLMARLHERYDKNKVKGLRYEMDPDL